MRTAVALLLIGTMLAGCQVPDDANDFERSCPTWFSAPDHPQFNSDILFLHNADSNNPEIAENKEGHKRWLIHPGVSGGHFYRNGTTDYYLVDIELFVEDENGTRHTGVYDATLRLEAYGAEWEGSGREDPTAKPIPEPTGPRLIFIDMTDPSNPRRTSFIEVREGEILDKQYKFAFTDGTGPADPWSLRIDMFFTGDLDKDDDTPAVVAGLRMTAERWYRHNDCIP